MSNSDYFLFTLYHGNTHLLVYMNEEDTKKEGENNVGQEEKDELTVHHTTSTRDVEVYFFCVSIYVLTFHLL